MASVIDESTKVKTRPSDGLEPYRLDEFDTPSSEEAASDSLTTKPGKQKAPSTLERMKPNNISYWDVG